MTWPALPHVLFAVHSATLASCALSQACSWLGSLTPTLCIPDSVMPYAQDKRGTAGERRVDPTSLQGVHKKRKDKQERLAAVLAGKRQLQPLFLV